MPVASREAMPTPDTAFATHWELAGFGHGALHTKWSTSETTTCTIQPASATALQPATRNLRPYPQHPDVLHDKQLALVPPSYLQFCNATIILLLAGPFSPI